MLCKYKPLLFGGLDMQMLNSGWTPSALFEVLSNSSHSNSHVTSGCGLVGIQHRNSHLSYAQLGLNSYTCPNQVLVIMRVPEMGKPREPARSGVHFLIILHPLTHTCGLKVDSSLSTLMSSRIILPSFMGILIFKALYRQVSVIPLGSQRVSVCDLQAICPCPPKASVLSGKNILTCS